MSPPHAHRIEVGVSRKLWNRIEKRLQQHWYDTGLLISFQEKFGSMLCRHLAPQVDRGPAKCNSPGQKIRNSLLQKSVDKCFLTLLGNGCRQRIA
jgi:hypothetical protein